jgi:hypothetical protein
MRSRRPKGRVGRSVTDLRRLRPDAWAYREARGGLTRRARTRARRTAGSRPVLAAAVFGLVMVVATVFVARQGLRIHGLVFYDEKYSVEGARFLETHLDWLLSHRGYAGRGLERLTAVLLLPVVWLFPSTADQFVAGHWIMAASWALIGLPIYAFARGMRLPRRWAVAAAAMTVFVPWAVFGTIFINTAPGTLTALVALWAMWRATLRPSLAADAFALALIGIAALARVSHAGLAAAWPIAIAVQAWRDAPPTSSPIERLRAMRDAFWRSHPLLLGAGVAAVGLLAWKGADAVVGGYPSQVGFPAADLWRRVQLFVAHGATGMSFLAFIVGAAWLVKTTVSARDRRTGAFAVLAAGASCALLYVNHLGGFDERYEMPAFALLSLSFAVALARREIGVVAPLVAGAVTMYCVQRYGVIDRRIAFDYLNAPGRQWFSAGWIRSLSDTFELPRWSLVAAVVVAATSVAVVLGAVRGAASRWLVRSAVVLMLWSGFAGARFLMVRLPSGYRPDASFADLTFVDRLTGGKDAQPLIGPPRSSQAVRNTWLELQFFNGAIKRPLSLTRTAYQLCCLTFGDPVVASVDARTGSVSSRSGAIAPYVLTSANWVPGGLAGRWIATSSAAYQAER